MSEYAWREGEVSTAAAERGVESLLRSLGYLTSSDPTVDLTETPARVVRAWRELTAGTTLNPYTILTDALFHVGRLDETRETDPGLVVVRGIEFTSVCAHHLMPFSGVASVAYYPAATLVGLSKIPRVVLAYAQRLQLQEWLCEDILRCLVGVLRPRGAAVRLRASHGCMACRGVRQPNADMVTTLFQGCAKDDPFRRDIVAEWTGGGR